MALTAEQNKLLTVINKKALEQVSINAQQNMREVVLQNLQRQMSERSQSLKEGMDLKVGNSKGKQQNVLSYDIRDQTLEFDLDEQLDGYRLMEDEDPEADLEGQNFLKHLEAGKIVTELSHQLEAEVEIDVPDLDSQGKPQFDKDGNLITKKVKQKLFSDKDLGKALGDELYQPLVREGLLAETFVPDDFSETREMLVGSFEAYKERLEEEGVTHFLLRKENIAMATTFFSSTTTMISAGGNFKSAMNIDPKDVGVDKLKPGLDFFKDDLNKKREINAVADMISLSFDGLMNLKEGGGDIAEAISSRLGKERAPALTKIAAALVNMAGIKLAEAFSDPLLPSQLNVALTTVFNSQTDSSAVAVGLINSLDEGQEASLKDAAKALGSGMDKALDKAGISGKADPKLAHDFATELANGIDAAKIAEDLREELYEAPMQSIATLVGNALSSKAPEFIKHLKSIDAKKLTTDLCSAVTEEMNKSIEQDHAESKKQLAAIANEKDEEKRASLIEEKIKELERQTKIIDWAVKLSKMSFDVASKFIGPLAIGGSLVKLMENTAKATARACDAHLFLQKKEDMLHAASPYSAPVTNFIKNARSQAIHYSINAALDGLNMAGAIVETLGYASGPGAAAAVAAGKIMQALASSAQALEAVCYEIAKRVNLEQAWSFYRSALSRPENRKLGLMAMKKNPTLAKYAVAWGAIIKHDVLVIDFVQQTGLTAESLRDPKAKVQDAVKYLELRFSDDNVVTGRKANASWEPDKVELTVACFVSAKAKAIKSDKLVDSNTRAVELALANFEKEGSVLYAKAAPLLTETYPRAAKDMVVAKGGRVWVERGLYENSSGADATIADPGAIGANTAFKCLLTATDAQRLDKLCQALSNSLLAYKPLESGSNKAHQNMQNFKQNLMEMANDISNDLAQRGD